MLYFSTVMYIPFLIIFGIFHLIVMPRSILLLTAYSIASVYITIQLMMIGCFKRFAKYVTPCTSPTVCRLLLWLTMIVATVTTSLNMFLCRPISEIHLVTDPTGQINFVDSHQRQAKQFHPFNDLKRNFTISTLLVDYNSFEEESFLSSSSPSTSMVVTTSPSNLSNHISEHYCFFYDQFIIIGCLSMLISGLLSSAALYATNRKAKLSVVNMSVQRMDETLEFIATPQLTRVFIGLIIFTLHIGIILWTTDYNGLFYVFQAKNEGYADNNSSTLTSSIQPNLFSRSFVHSLFAQFAFFLLTVLLPRSLEYQSRLIKQWKLKSQSAVEKLSLTSLALARLLISIVPRFVIAKISNPERVTEIFSKPYHNIGVVLIQFIVVPSKSSTVVLTQSQPQPQTPPPPPQQQQQQERQTYNSAATARTSDDNNSKLKAKSISEEPIQIADRIRLLNRVIHLVDSLAVGQKTTSQQSSTQSTAANDEAKPSRNKEEKEKDSTGDKVFGLSSSSSSTSTDSSSTTNFNLLKIYAGGSMVGYATGIEAIDDAACQNHHPDQSAITLQWTSLMKFLEKVIIICDELNQQKMKLSTSTSSSSPSSAQIYVQAALHTGSCILGFVSNQHPVFTMWGEPLEICRQLLSKHQLTHLNSQHFLLTTDELISSIPVNILNSSSILHHSTSCQPISSNLNNINNNLLYQPSFTWCTVDPTNGKIILSSQLQRPLSLVKVLNSRPPYIDRLLHFCNVRLNSNNESYSEIITAAATVTDPRRPVCSLFNMYNLPTAMMSPNITTTATSTTDVPVLLQAGSNKKQNYVEDSTNFDTTNHQLTTNVSRLPVVGVRHNNNNTTTNDNGERRLSTSILTLNPLNSVASNPIRLVVMPSTTVASLTNVPELDQYPRRTSQLLTTVSILSTPQTTQCQLLPPPPPPPAPPRPPHQRAYPSTSRITDAPLPSHTLTLMSSVVTMTGDNTNENSHLSPLQTSSPQSGHFITDRMNTRNIMNSQGVKPIRPNSYWPVPDELPSDKLQSHHDSISCKEKLNRPISVGIVKRFDGMMMNILGNREKPSNCLRPTSLSSTDSFLVAERVCAAYASEIDESKDEEVTTTTRTTDNNVSSQNDNTQKLNIRNSQSIYNWSHVQSAIDKLSSVQYYNNKNTNHSNDNANNNNDFDDEEEDIEDKKNNMINPDAISHHNPLYTDNEYESMAESQGNLLDIVDHPISFSGNKSISNNSNDNKVNRISHSALFATLSHIDPRDRFVHQPSTDQTECTTQKVNISNDDDKNVNFQMSVNKSSVFRSVVNPTSTSVIGTNFLGTTHQLTNNMPFQSANQPLQSVFDFPDYQRPSSPGGGCYRHEKMVMTSTCQIGTDRLSLLSCRKTDQVMKQQVGNSIKRLDSTTSSSPISVAASSSTDHSLTSDPRSHHEMITATVLATAGSDTKKSTHSSGSNSQHLHSQSNRFPVIESSCADHIVIPNISNPRNIHPVNHQFVMNEPMERYDIPYIPHKHSKLTSSREPECSDAEYMGTASFGPLSMAVLTSMTEDGLTSCDGDELTEDDDCLDLMTDNNDLLLHNQNFINNPHDMNAYSSRWYSVSSEQDNRISNNTHDKDNDDKNYEQHDNIVVHGMMTDSLLANPDVDADDSELDEDFDYTPTTAEQVDEGMDSRIYDHQQNNGQLYLNQTKPGTNQAIINTSWRDHITMRDNTTTSTSTNQNTPMLLEAALLSTSTTPLSQFGIVDSSSNENYPHSDSDKKEQRLDHSLSSFGLDDLGSEDLFAYHGRIGQRLDYNPLHNNESSYSSSIHPSSSKNNTHSHQIDEQVNKKSPNARNSSLLYNNLGPRQAVRPSLPEVAPVGLPDFSHHPQASLIMMPWYTSSSAPSDKQVIPPSSHPFLLSSAYSAAAANPRPMEAADLSSDYDNIYAGSFHPSSKYAYGCRFNLQINNATHITSTIASSSSKPAVIPTPTLTTAVSGCGSRRPALRKLTKAQQNHTNWQLIMPGEESDAMSGYIGDAASSVYDTGDDDDDSDEDEDNNHYRKRNK
ncbi:unnamed protein product [Heterobilharzia americana]|nr:unnamed protein product [Heterobilharzia americana]